MVVSSLVTASVLREPVKTSFHRLRQVRHVKVHPQTDRHRKPLANDLDLTKGIIPAWASKLVEADHKDLVEWDCFAYSTRCKPHARRMHMVLRDANGQPRRLMCKLNHTTGNLLTGEVAETFDPAAREVPVEAFCPKCYCLLTASLRARVKIGGLEVAKD